MVVPAVALLTLLLETSAVLAGGGGEVRRRRMAALSSVGRESLTCESEWPQNGHRIDLFPPQVYVVPNRSHLPVDGKLTA